MRTITPAFCARARKFTQAQNAGKAALELADGVRENDLTAGVLLQSKTVNAQNHLRA